MGALGGRTVGAAACFITPDLYLHMELDPHLAYSIRSRGESRVWVNGGGGSPSIY